MARKSYCITTSPNSPLFPLKTVLTCAFLQYDSDKLVSVVKGSTILFAPFPTSSTVAGGEAEGDAFSAGDSAVLLQSVGLGAVGGGREVESPGGSVYSRVGYA